MDLTPHRAGLLRPTRTDPDPCVRHRAGRLPLAAGGLPLSDAARRFGCARNSLRAWGRRYLADGRDGLVDRRRPGRPPALDRRARRLLAAALASSPLRHVHRTLRAMGYRYRRPRHDPRHRRDTGAVASAQRAPAELRERGPLPTPSPPPATGAAPATGSSTWTSATSTPTPAGRRSGSAGASR